MLPNLQAKMGPKELEETIKVYEEEEEEDDQ